MRRIIVYNIIIIVVLFGSMELTTRVISWISGHGFTLALHEVDPFDRKIKDIYQWHPFVGFTFQPNSALSGSHPNQEKRAQIFIDQHGFLATDKDLELEKKANEIRIATIGGSTTASINLSYEQNWPGYLGNLIQQEFPDKKVRIINAGVPGFDTAQSIGNLALRVLPFRPDVVIIYHAYNDLKTIRGDLPFKSDYTHIHPKPYGFHKEPNWFIRFAGNSMLYVRTRNLVRDYKTRKQADYEKLNNQNRLATIPRLAERAFEEHIRALVAIARSAGASVILSSFATLHDPYLDWRSPEKTMRALSEFQKDNLGGLLQFTPGLTIPAIFEGIRRYNEVLYKVAVGENTGWVDNSKLVPHADQYFLDRVHFSDAGAKLMAQNLVPHVNAILIK